MNITSIITFLTLQILLLSTISGADSLSAGLSSTTDISADSTILHLDSDTSKQHSGNISKVDPLISAKNSTTSHLLNKEKQRKSIKSKIQNRSTEHHHHNIDPYINDDPYHLGSSELFLTDGTAPSEALHSHPFITTARYGLSTSQNRYMLFGAVAPVNKIYTGKLLYQNFGNAVKGTDQTSLIDISDITLNNSATLHYYHNLGQIATPEAHLFWENGVFGENLLLVSISRPLSKNLIVNVFTNYRHFRGGTYSQSSDISSFFKGISDTNYIAGKGYNPLTDEFLVGTNVAWIGLDKSQLHLKLTYGDLNHEISVDNPVQFREKLDHALYHRYPLQIDLGSSWNLTGPFFFDFEAKFREEPFIRIIGDTVDNKVVPIRHDAKDREFNLAVRPGIEVAKNDSLGLCYNFNRTAYTLFNQSDMQINLHQPELQYDHHFRLNNLEGVAKASAGLTFFSMEDTSAISTNWNLSASLKGENQQYRIYFQQDNIPFTINYDSLLYDQVLLDGYYKAGAEVDWNWGKAGLLLGYQFVYGTDSSTVLKSWPMGVVPYQQPVSSFVVAPTLGRWHGLALKSNLMISDSKPFLKIHSALSFVAHPVNTREYIDAALTFDYWSERDNISFAGFQDWNVPIYNIGLEMAAHIRSFRLFYKVDNILNRRFAYVPGYYSPGITFRWGFNWYLQR